MAKKMAEAQIKATEGMPVHKDYGDKGYKWIELQKPRDLTELPAGYKAEPYKGQYSEGVKILNPAGEQVSVGESLDDALKNMSEVRLEEALKYEGETMGHCVGGYCPDVLEGRSRIYSLRDAKGEPHVTVEVQPNKHLDFNKWFASQPQELRNEINARARRGEHGGSVFEAPEYLAARKALPPRIQQIKGKQNRAPKEEYLPYVQDFVKGGKWSDVGDLQNTGLYSAKDVDRIMPEGVQMSRNARTLALGRARRAGELPEYMTREEYEAMIQKHVPEDIWAAEKAQRAAEDDELLRQLRPPEDGMAHGGEVHMAGGGLLKSGLKKLAQMAGEAPAGVEPIVVKKGTLSTARNESKAADEAMEAKRLAFEAANPPIKASEAYGQHEGAYLKPIFYDRMKVDLSKQKFGGPGFSSIQLVDPNYANAAAGVTDQKMATRILNRNKAQVPQGAKVIWTPSVGGLEQHKSNSTMFNEFADIFSNQRKKMSDEQIQKLSDRASKEVDNKGRLIFPDGIDLGARNFRQQVKTYDQRSLMANIFAGRGVGGEKGRTVPMEELLEKNLDPYMANAGTLDLGNRLFRLEGNVMDRPDLHSDYRKILTGEDLNVNYLPVPIRDVYSEWEAQKLIDLAAQGKNRPVTLMDYTKNDPTVQLTEKLLTDLQKQGFKKGGDVKLKGGLSAATKSCSCHD
jgi:hypothetical protein